MVNQISGAGNMMSTMQNQLMNRQPPPPVKDTFQVADTNQDGVVSKEELEAVASAVAELTETDISQENMLADFDMDSNGGVSGEELLQMLSSYNIAMLSNYHIPSSEIVAVTENSEVMKPASARNSRDNSTANLVELFNKGTDDSSGNVTPINVEV